MPPAIPSSRSLGAILCLGLALGAPPPPLRAQAPSAPPTPQNAPASDPRRQPIKLDDLPPQVRLGVRCEMARRQLMVAPVVVIVSDLRSYVAAIGRWSPRARFPVLLDDGTWSAREDIARFVRAFQPQRILTWIAPDDALWPDLPTDQQALIERVVANFWGAKDWADYPARLRATNATPPGIVVASVKDPAWTAALPLAAARGQLLTWIDSPDSNVNGTLAMSDADALSERLSAFAEASTFSWNAMGDDLDAITLCMALPARTLWKTPPGASAPAGIIWPVNAEPVATTDLIGRHPRGDRLERWAWAGQLWGTHARAAYLAMSSLFLQPRRAWVFDAYADEPPWNLWDGEQTVDIFKKINLPADLDDSPAQSLADWRDRIAGAWRARPGASTEKDRDPVGCLDAMLVCVNSSGMSESFDLRPGQALSADVPFLHFPALVHFVHSWSAQSPANRFTVAGRWIERGAFAYVGSVHEPYLSGFQPTPSFVKRMAAPTALGVAARLDGAPPWRIAVLGDPLYTMGPPSAPSTIDFPLERTIDLREALRPLLRDSNFEAAFANLLMGGRDADLVRLVKAAIRQDPGKLTATAEKLALLPALRRADLEAIFLLLPRILDRAPAAPPDAVTLDALWHALRPGAATLSLDRLRLLGHCLRDDCFARDAEDVARLIRRIAGDAARREFLESAMAATPDAGRRAALDKLLIAPPD
ncbi:MAG: hypothetical protein AB7Q91_06350 [Phycisphaerales bacterium]